MRQDFYEALRHCPLFSGMADADIGCVTAATAYRTVSLSRHDIYCLSGDICRHADIVIEGELVARISGLSGRQVEVISLHRGDIIGPCFIFASDKRLPVDIEAESDVTLLRLSASALQQMIDSNPTVRRNFVRHLSDLSSYLAEKIGFLSLFTVREKVVWLLRTEAAMQHSRHIRLDTSRQRIADSFAIQKFSLLRCLADLSQQGIVKVEGKNITILAPDRLR